MNCAEIRTKLGTVTTTWRGQHDPSLKYYLLNTVRDNTGNTYLCILNAEEGVPLSDENHWVVIGGAGPAPVLNRGTTTTLPRDTPASVDVEFEGIVDGIPNYKLNFNIPRGDSDLYIGSETPDNPEYDLWLDPNGSVVQPNFIRTLSYTEYVALPIKSSNVMYACTGVGDTIERLFIGDKEISLGTPAEERRTLTITINPANVAHVEDIIGEGNGVQKTVSATKNIYTFSVLRGYSLTINIVPKEGFEVDNLNINTIPQGNVASYFIASLENDSTGYLWMKEAEPEEVPLPIFTRSDVPGVTYDTIQDALIGVTADYGHKLTQDVTILCTQEGIVPRHPLTLGGRENARLHDFNRDSLYTLTIDGANLCTIDGGGFGGIYLESCGNVAIKNLTFQNCNTYEGIYAPEEPACIYAANVRDTGCRNLYVDNVTIVGLSTKSAPSANFRTRYGITIKKWENVYISNVTMTDIAVSGIKTDTLDIITLSKVKITGNVLHGVIGHPRLLTTVNVTEAHITDCEFIPNNFDSYIISGSNVNNFIFNRNIVKNALGPILSLADFGQNNKIEISYNYLSDLVKAPRYSWETQWFALSARYKEVIVTNNLVEFTTNYYQEFFVRSSMFFEKFVNVNNIYIKKGGRMTGIINVPFIGQYISGKNLYKTDTTIYNYLENVPWADRNKLENLQANDMEIGSGRVDVGTLILNSEAGGARLCLNSTFAPLYKANTEYVSEFDGLYKLNNSPDNTIGYDNSFGTPFNETLDTTLGYTIKDSITGTTADETNTLDFPANDLLHIYHKTKNRNKFIKYFIINSDTGLPVRVILGRFGSLSLAPKLTVDGEFAGDQFYNINIES